VPLSGDVVLNNGWIVPKSYGHWNHGYNVTSQASQGSTVDRVLVAQSAESFGATSAEQLYVSSTRGRKSVEVFTDDKEALSKRVAEFSEQVHATDLAPRNEPEQLDKEKRRGRNLDIG